MKHHRFVGRMISVSLALLALMAGTTTSRAALDAYLKIDGMSGPAKGFHAIVHCINGSVDAGKLPVGTFNVQVAWVDGGKTSMDDWSQIRAMAAKSQGAPVNYTVIITTKPSSAPSNVSNSYTFTNANTASHNATASNNIMGMPTNGSGMTSGSATTNGSAILSGSATTSATHAHTPITIRKEVDAASPKFISISIASGDVDGDGTVDVMMAVKTQGASIPAKN